VHEEIDTDEGLAIAAHEFKRTGTVKQESR